MSRRVVLGLTLAALSLAAPAVRVARGDDGAEPGAATPQALATRLEAAFQADDPVAAQSLVDPVPSVPEVSEPMLAVLRAQRDFTRGAEAAARRFGADGERLHRRAGRKLFKAPLSLSRLAASSQLSTDGQGRTKLVEEPGEDALRRGALPVVQRDGRWYVDTASPWPAERARALVPMLIEFCGAARTFNQAIETVLADPALDLAGFQRGTETAGRTLAESLTEINLRAERVAGAPNGSDAPPPSGSGSGSE